MTAARPGTGPGLPVQAGAAARLRGPCGCTGQPAVRDAGWQRAARQARWLAWASLAWMCAEGAVGLWQGLAAGSVALTGWALGSAVEGLASVIVIWRFTGARTLSETAERRAQRGVAVSFWLLAPYIAAESVRDLATGHHAETTVIGIGADRRRAAGDAAAGPGQAQARGPAGLGRHRRGRHPELPVRRPGRRRAARAGHHRRLAWRPGGSTPSSAWASPRSRRGRAPNPGAATTAADHADSRHLLPPSGKDPTGRS